MSRMTRFVDRNPKITHRSIEVFEKKKEIEREREKERNYVLLVRLNRHPQVPTDTRLHMKRAKSAYATHAISISISVPEISA